MTDVESGLDQNHGTENSFFNAFHSYLLTEDRQFQELTFFLMTKVIKNFPPVALFSFFSFNKACMCMACVFCKGIILWIKLDHYSKALQLHLRPNTKQLQIWDKNSTTKTRKAESSFFKSARKMTGLRSAEAIWGKSKINVASNLNTALRHLACPSWNWFKIMSQIWMCSATK